MNSELLLKLATQLNHMDILEDKLLSAQIQLKKMREEHEEIIQLIIKENR